MSHIFEALQQAEAERSGGSVGSLPSSLAELLDRSRSAPTESSSAPPVLEGAAAAPGLPSDLLSAVPIIVPNPARDARLVCLTDPGSLAAEKFRVLGLRLRNLREKRVLKKIAVTSTIPEEGKTMTAANLALNQSRSKVLKAVLVDGDLRRPSLASRFGLSPSLPGLAEYLRGEKRLSEVLYKLQNTQLWFVPAGLPPNNPLELMQSGRLTDVLGRLGEVFDWIIIDCPPLIPLADASFWMKISDGVLLVAREGVTEKKPLERALEIVDRSVLIGVVINGCSGGDHKNYYQRYGQVSAAESGSPTAEND